ncbi:MAG: AMP-binding protein [Clostridia bacterium]|nr:AMP-binding protein [Clostridia bacterium]
MDTYFVEKMRRNAEKYPDRLALALDFHEEPVTCAELWDRSGRIYAALREKGLGREDFIMLLLPRSPRMFIAMLGVLRAGAAFVFMEDTYPEDRVRAIREDLNIRLVLDLSVYEAAMALPSLSGYESTDPHDACFSFSTSGTTGKPKTMIHEYGKLDVCLDSWYADVPDLHEESPRNFAMIFPFNFAAAFVLPLPKLYAADPVFIMSYDTVKNLVRFEEFLTAENIGEIYLSPSFLRTYKGSYHNIRKIIAAGEPATGVYKEGIDIHAYYGMSETCFMVSSFLLDKAHDRAIVGKNNFGLRLLILDENGNSVQQGETGEVCFDNPYFRGYLNLPELNEEVRGYGIFHSRDLGYIDENGNLVIRGRLDDMVKINGNRVEPLEIELTVRKTLGIEHPVAKSFTAEGRTFIVLYCLKSEKTPVLDDPAEVRRILSKCLPGYMIPTYYIALDAFPLNANGKLSRKMLPAPDIREYRNAYVKPENEAEEMFCNAMAEVLGLEKVGADEDFFLIGGDSLTAIRMITACAEAGCFITVNGLYECRTAGNLAARFGQEKAGTPEELRRENENAEKEPADLTAGQLFQLEMALNQKKPRVITYHAAMIFTLQPGVDTERLRAAAEKALRNHPAFLSGFRKDASGKVCQYYDESLFTPVGTVTMTDEAFAAAKPALVTPMDPLSGSLYRCSIIVTPSHNYFFCDFHHLIADEMSLSVFVREVADRYLDSGAELPADRLYLILRDEKQARNEETARATREHLAAVRKKEHFSGRGILKQDLPGPETGTGVFYVPDAFQRSDGYSARLFLTACAMSVAEMNGEDAAMVYSNYHGRDTFLKNDSVNCYVTPVPVILNSRDGRSPAEMLNDVREQSDYGAAHCSFPFILENSDVLGNTVMFNYRNGTMNIGRFSALCSDVYLCPKPAGQPNCLVIAGIVGRHGSDELGFYCTYPEGLYSKNRIREFYECFVSAVKKLTGKDRV